MKARARATVVIAVLVAFALTATAQAHQLKISRAAKANHTFTKLLCAASNDPKSKCVSSESGDCQRISDHRVRCSMFLTLEAEDKSQARCRALIEWVIPSKGGSMRPDFLGIRSCSQVRGPESPPPPTG